MFNWFKTEEQVFSDIVGVFTATQDKLKAHLFAIDDAIEEQDLKAAEALKEKERLGKHYTKVNVVINKFNEILGAA